MHRNFKDQVGWAPRAVPRSSVGYRTLMLLAALSIAGPVGAAPAAGIIESVAGSGLGDGQSPQHAIIDPRGVAVQIVGGITVVYIADGQNHVIRKVTLGGSPTVATIAGTRTAGFSGDGGAATSATLSFPTEVAVAGDGSIYVADTNNNRVRRITTSGIITTVAGNGQLSTAGDGGAATNASIAAPRGLAIDSQGSLYIAEFTGNVIRKVSNGTISRFAGTGSWGFGGDGGAAAAATLANPSGLAFDSRGNLFVADYNNQRIRKIAVDGTISTIAGDGYVGFLGNGGPAQAARLNLPYRLAFDSGGNLLVAESGNNVVRRVAAIGGSVSGAGIISTVAGNTLSGSGGDGGPATAASLVHVNGLGADVAGNIYIGTTSNSVPNTDNRVRLVNNAGIISSAIGGGNGDGGPAIHAIIEPANLEVGSGPKPDIYIADGAGSLIRKIDGRSGIISTVAGNGTEGFSGDGGPATAASLKSAFDIARSSDGTMFIADTLNNRIRRVSSGGVISTYAGTGTYGYGGDNGDATLAKLALPYGVTLDADGNLYVADFANSRVRKITPSRSITTVVGNGFWGNGGDNGPATEAYLSSPTDIVISPDGTMYIADYSNHVVRRVRSGVIDRFAGTGTPGFSGDGGAATSAKLNYPFRLALDTYGNLYIADADNRRIRRVDPGGIITTIAGNGVTANTGDGGWATSASLVRPTGLATTEAGDVLVSQSDSYRVRQIGAPQAVLGMTVSGIVQHASIGVGVGGVTLSLTSGSGQTPLQTLSDTNGAFGVSGVQPGSWGLSPAKQGGVLSAVSAIDAAYALEATVGQRALSREALLGCDANASGNLSAIDASYILQYRVGLLERLPAATACGSDWIFDPLAPTSAAVSATSASLSSGRCQQGKLSYSSLGSSLQGQSFKAIPLGDCNLSWQAGASGAARAGNDCRLRIGRPRVHGTRVWFPIIVDQCDEFRALEASVEFNTSVLSQPTLYLASNLEGSLVETNPNVAGQLSVALARLEPAAAGRVAWIGFRVARDRTVRRPSLRLNRWHIENG